MIIALLPLAYLITVGLLAHSQKSGQDRKLNRHSVHRPQLVSTTSLYYMPPQMVVACISNSLYNADATSALKLYEYYFLSDHDYKTAYRWLYVAMKLGSDRGEELFRSHQRNRLIDIRTLWVEGSSAAKEDCEVSLPTEEVINIFIRKQYEKQLRSHMIELGRQ